MPKIFITGASGCVGHYVTEALAALPDTQLYLLVRDPSKMRLSLDRNRHTLVQSSLEDIGTLQPLLSEMNAVVHTATAWGDVERAQRVNVDQTLALFNSLDRDRCQKIIYFSTASLLDRNNQPMGVAAEAGTEYIRTKYEMLLRRSELSLRDRLITMYPTLVFGGSPQHSYSQITLGLAEIRRYLGLIRFLRADASFHFVHAADIAQVVVSLLQEPTMPAIRDLVMGAPAITVNSTIKELCQFYKKRIYFQIPLPVKTFLWLAPLLRIQLSSWDRHCLNDLHFTHHITNPESFSKTSQFSTLADILNCYG